MVVFHSHRACLTGTLKPNEVPNKFPPDPLIPPLAIKYPRV